MSAFIKTAALSIKTAALSMGILSALFFISCNEDGDGTPAYEFKDQNLQGKIDGIDFNLGDGTVESSDGELSFDLYSDEEPTAACELFGFGGFVQIFFTIPAETGVIELFLDFSAGEGQTVTMFNPENTLNVIATQGAVEITEITETTVAGRMDIKYDGSSFLNGNFTVGFCE